MLGSKVWPISSSNIAQAPTTSAMQAVEDSKKLALWPALEGFTSNFSPFWPLGPLEKLSFTQLHLLHGTLLFPPAAPSKLCKLQLLSKLHLWGTKKKKVIFFERGITCWLFSYRFGSQKNLEEKKNGKPQLGFM